MHAGTALSYRIPDAVVDRFQVVAVSYGSFIPNNQLRVAQHIGLLVLPRNIA